MSLGGTLRTSLAESVESSDESQYPTQRFAFYHQPLNYFVPSIFHDNVTQLSQSSQSSLLQRSLSFPTPQYQVANSAGTSSRFKLIEEHPHKRKKIKRQSSSRSKSFCAKFIVQNQANKPQTIINYPVHELEYNHKNFPPEIIHVLKSQIYPSISTKKYSAPVIEEGRSSLSVYEYPIGDHWIIWDRETGVVHLTGLWRAAIQESEVGTEIKPSVHIRPNAKADIVKLLESTPQALHSGIKRVRGGFLRIQGTWVPHKFCKRLARHFCYYIRYKLVPIFGPDFPDSCILPSDEGFGQLCYHISKKESLPPDTMTGLPTSGSHILESLPRVSPKLQISEADKHNRQSFSYNYGPFLSSSQLPHVSQDYQTRPPINPSSSVLPSLACSLDESRFFGENDNSTEQRKFNLPPPTSFTQLNEASSIPKVETNSMAEIWNASNCLHSLRKRNNVSPASSTTKMKIGNLLS